MKDSQINHVQVVFCGLGAGEEVDRGDNQRDSVYQSQVRGAVHGGMYLVAATTSLKIAQGLLFN